MIRSCLLFTLLASGSAFGQPEKEPPYQVPAPKGWAKETIALPPAFAPDMKWKGKEELRFAPNWLKADGGTFFSYTLLFWLPDDQKVDSRTIEQELLSYYRGLAKAVLEHKKQEVDVGAFTLSVKDAPDNLGKRPGGEPVASYVGELKWTEPLRLYLCVSSGGKRRRVEDHARDPGRLQHSVTGMAAPNRQQIDKKGMLFQPHSWGLPRTCNRPDVHVGFVCYDPCSSPVLRGFSRFGFSPGASARTNA